jgi:hypothetical protein
MDLSRLSGKRPFAGHCRHLPYIGVMRSAAAAVKELKNFAASAVGQVSLSAAEWTPKSAIHALFWRNG